MEAEIFFDPLAYYTDVSSNINGAGWFYFMNHGYSPLAIQLKPQDERWLHQISLYNHLVMKGIKFGMSIKDKAILEVGCGRGGGISFIKRYYCPHKAIGLDLIANHIKFCETHHTIPNLAFTVGDACELPFENNSFDAVINVESAHCYRDLSLFFSEVRRILKPNGYFLFADTGAPSELYELDTRIKKSGMHVLDKEDITQNVLAAQRKDRVRFNSVFEGIALAEDINFLLDIAKTKQAIYEEKNEFYMAYVMRKDTLS